LKITTHSLASDTAAVTADDMRATRRSLFDRFPGLWIGLILIITMAVFTASVPNLRFTNLANLTNIAQDSSEVLIMAVATTLILIAGGIDLSIGSVLVLSSVAAALVMGALSGTHAQVSNFQYPDEGIAIPVGILSGIMVGTLVGFANGLLIAYLRLPAFIVTLGISGVALGAALVITNGENTPYVPPDFQRAVGVQRIVGFIPVPVLLAFVLAGVGWVVLARTRFGIYTYAIGANAQASRRAGVNVKRHLLILYTVSGLSAGIAGLVDVGRFDTTSIEGHQADNLQAIAAVVLGGTSLFGGSGGLGGTVIAVFFPSVLYNGFIQLGLQPFWQGIVIGVVLIAAVYFDALRRSRRSAGGRED